MLSIIVPVYNEEENLLILYEKLREVVIANNLKYELVFVDDHSSDGSYGLLVLLAKKDSNVKVIRLSKNQGSHIALRAGLAYCRGDYACNLSADLQEPTDLIIKLYKAAREGRVDIVWAYRKERKDSFYRRMLSEVYKIFIKNFTHIQNFRQVCDIFCISRKVINAMNKVQTKNISLFLALLDVGFEQSQIPYVRQERKAGKSKFTFYKKIKLFADSFFPFSYFPIRALTLFGFFMAGLAFLFMLFISYNKIINNGVITGWSSIMVAILFFSSLQLIMLGIIGEYLLRTYDRNTNVLFYVEKSIGIGEEEHGNKCGEKGKE